MRLLKNRYYKYTCNGKITAVLYFNSINKTELNYCEFNLHGGRIFGNIISEKKHFNIKDDLTPINNIEAFKLLTVEQQMLDSFNKFVAICKIMDE